MDHRHLNARRANQSREWNKYECLHACCIDDVHCIERAYHWWIVCSLELTLRGYVLLGTDVGGVKCISAYFLDRSYF